MTDDFLYKSRPPISEAFKEELYRKLERLDQGGVIVPGLLETDHYHRATVWAALLVLVISIGALAALDFGGSMRSQQSTARTGSVQGPNTNQAIITQSPVSTDSPVVIQETENSPLITVNNPVIKTEPEENQLALPDALPGDYLLVEAIIEPSGLVNVVTGDLQQLSGEYKWSNGSGSSLVLTIQPPGKARTNLLTPSDTSRTESVSINGIPGELTLEPLEEGSADREGYDWMRLAWSNHGSLYALIWRPGFEYDGQPDRLNVDDFIHIAGLIP